MKKKAGLTGVRYVMVRPIAEVWKMGRVISIDKSKGILLGSVRGPYGATVARRRFEWSDLRDDPPFWHLGYGSVPK